MYSLLNQFKINLKSSLSPLSSLVLKIIFCCFFISTIASAGWTVKNERSFTLRNTSGSTGVNIYGDFGVTGAPILCIKKTNGQCDWNYTGLLATADSKFLTDKPTSQIPLNSSSADLTIPSDATITKAYLYWNGHIHGSTATQAAYNAAIADYNSVIFRTPDGVDHTITANVNDTTKVNFYAYLNDTNNNKGFRHFYQATADVTTIVKNGGYASNKKQFTVGNIKTTAGTDQVLYEPEVNGNVTWGPMGGWSLIVEYTRPVASGQQYKNVSIYDGFQFLLPPTNQTESIDINISGFLTPLTQVPTGSMAFYAMGSEKSLTGEKVKLSNKSGTLQDVYNSINPVGEFLNDSISIFGVNLDATRIFNPGIDLDVFNIATSCKNTSGATVACIDSNQTSTILQLSVKNNNNTSDQSFPGMIAFSVDIHQPDISAFIKDSNTSATQILNPGDYVEYTLDLNNSGTEAAENITIFDTFSSTVGGDMLLDIIDRNATAIKNSIRLKTFAEANYHCATGSTDPSCATLAKDANCSVDYADNNISQATKVWCNVPFMAVNDRELMKFTIKIRDDYNQSLPEQNATNIAYAEYYNAATHEKVTLLGQSNINTAGIVGGATHSTSIMDVVDTYNNTYSYNILTGLKTRIASSTNNLLEAVYLGTDASNPTPTIYIGPTYDMLVLFRLSNDTCTEDSQLSTSGDATTTFFVGANQYTAVSNAFTLVNKAKKIAKIKTHFIDWNKLSLNLVGNNCTNNSSITGNLKGVPQCLNGNADKIQPLMTVDVTECVTQATGQAACDSNAYDASGSKGNIVPSKYNNTYGCLMCLSDKVNSTNNCSRDNFAIRPNTFDSNIAANQIFVAEQNNTLFPITFRANQFGGTGTMDYNESMSDVSPSFAVDVNISDATKICAAPSIIINPAVSFTNGLVTNNYTFPNVGDFNLTIHDINGSEFALVDADDTLDAQRFITPFVQQIKVIPSYFTIDGNFSNASSDGTFTYLSNFETFPGNLDRRMSGGLDLNITAKSFLDNNLSNYTSLCYAKDGNLTINLPAPLSISPTTALTRMLWYDSRHDLNGSRPINNILTTYILDVNKTQFDSADANGTAKVLYWLNFDRNITKGVEPFNFDIQDVSHTNSDAVSGNRTLNANVMYYYGRVYSTDYQGVSPITASIYYEVYCNTCNRVAFNINGTQSPDSLTWYRNTAHEVAQDGDVELFSPLGGTTVNPFTTLVIVDGSETNILTNANAPYTDRIRMTPSSWLLYNAYNAGATTNDFNVEFVRAGNWAGQGEIGQTVDVNASVRTNRRIEW